jgi:hypothetical protein
MMMTDSLPLSELLARRVHLQWFEGVAIVRAVGERLLGHEDTALRIPELNEIELVADGTVTLAVGTCAKEPVRRLGQLLQAMLTDAEVPVQLRLIVSQATAPMPSYSSPAEFGRALAYFERPDRAGLLAAVFARAQAAGPATAGVALTLDRIVPLPGAAAASTPADAHVRISRRSIAIVAALLAALIVAGAAALRAGTSTTTPGRRLSHATTTAADVVGAALLVGLSAVSNGVGLGRIVAADAAAQVPTAAPLSTSARARRTKPVRPIATARELEKFGVESVPTHTIVVYDTPDGGASMNEDLGAHSELPERGPATAVDHVVYAPGAYGVSPPVGVHAQLPRELPPTVDPANLSRIELVIARDGRVESAKLLGNRRDVQGGMFLSAVKAWEFRPATKDGNAVRYRKTILVSFE